MNPAIALHFTVPGPPQGKGRARSTIRKAKSGKSFVGHYTPAKTRSYEQQVAAAALDAIAEGSTGAHWPTRGVVYLTMVAAMPIPASWPAWKRDLAISGQIMPTTKPDLDNIAKTVDSLNGIAWFDDAQVVDAHTRKRYAISEADVGVHVTVAVAATVYPAQITRRPHEEKRQ